MTEDLDVLVVGGTGVDHIVRVPLLPLPVRDSMTVPPIQSVVGHTGTGVALGCAALGLRTALVDVIGDDVEGRLVEDRFAAAGVELATLRHPSGTRHAVNLVTSDGSRMSLDDPGPPVDLGGDASLWRGPLDRSRHVHVTIMGWATPALADAASAGRTTSTDLHDWDAANPHHRPFARGGRPRVPLRCRAGLPSRRGGHRRPEQGRAEAVVVTNGAHGSTAYLFSWLAGASHADAARAGAVAGAWACGSPGTHAGLIDEPTLRGLIG